MDISTHATPLLPDVIPEIDANPVSFFAEERGGVSHGLELHSPSPFTSLPTRHLQSFDVYHNYLGFREVANLVLSLGTKT